MEKEKISGAYTPFGWARLAWELGLTRLFNRGARLIRRPLYLRGARHVDFGKRITIGRAARIEAYGKGREINIRFGDDVQLNDYVQVTAVMNVSIGNRVLVASRVFISDHNHGAYGENHVELRASSVRNLGQVGADHSSPTVPPALRPLAARPVTIEDDVWLGQGVCVLPGVTIGAGSVIGANAVVVNDIPPNSIAVGVPARVIRRYEADNGWVPIK